MFEFKIFAFKGFRLSSQAPGRRTRKCSAGQKIPILYLTTRYTSLLKQKERLFLKKLIFFQDIPVDLNDREYRQISYYQWVSIFLWKIIAEIQFLGAIFSPNSGLSLLYSLPYVAFNEW